MTDDADTALAPSLSVGTVLVPVDGSDDSVTAAEYGAAIADRYDADLHALYVHGEEVVRALEEDLVEPDEVSADAQSFLDEIEAIAEREGVTVTTSTAFGFSTRRKSQHPGSVVLDAAEEADADFVVLPRESITEERGDVLEKAAQYVLMYASQPVLSV